jgi:hypothetical protein
METRIATKMERTTKIATRIATKMGKGAWGEFTDGS